MELNACLLLTPGAAIPSRRVATLKKTCRRQLLMQQQNADISQLYEVDLEQQLEMVHMSFLRNIETIRTWKDALENPSSLTGRESPMLNFFSDAASRQTFYQTLQSILCCTYSLEQNHREALTQHFKSTQYGSKDMPIGDDNYLLLRSRIRDFSILNKS
ncbi:unnamed protein product [Soboliphyme baturini]|uniref:AATF-Che1 domain-containing protein n=1 Tax=Soboliphyme baturini TaxID=241478 RepID=A0A183I9N3_9BILA|nr:unnamed protein product [Soboliphyme baturini]